MHSPRLPLTRCLVACALICFIFCLATRPAHAQAGYYTYTLNNVTFGGASIDYFGSGTATGYFDYDPTTNTVGAYDITTSAAADVNGDPFGGFEYDNANSSGVFAQQYSTGAAVAFSDMNDDAFYLNFADATDDVERTAEGYGSVNSTSFDFDAFREGDTGTLTVTPAGNPAAVPELSPVAAIALLSALGCGALGLARARRPRAVSGAV